MSENIGQPKPYEQMPLRMAMWHMVSGIYKDYAEKAREQTGREVENIYFDNPRDMLPIAIEAAGNEQIRFDSITPYGAGDIEVGTTGGEFIEIGCFLFVDQEPYISGQDHPSGRPFLDEPSEYSILVSPEMPPVVVQVMQLRNGNFTPDLSKLPAANKHYLSDEECSQIAANLACLPIDTLTA